MEKTVQTHVQIGIPADNEKEVETAKKIQNDVNGNMVDVTSEMPVEKVNPVPLNEMKIALSDICMLNQNRLSVTNQALGKEIFR